MRENTFHTPDIAYGFAVVANTNPQIKMSLLFSEEQMAHAAASQKAKETGKPHSVVSVTVVSGSFW